MAIAIAVVLLLLVVVEVVKVAVAVVVDVIVMLVIVVLEVVISVTVVMVMVVMSIVVVVAVIVGVVMVVRVMIVPAALVLVVDYQMESTCLQAMHVCKYSVISHVCMYISWKIKFGLFVFFLKEKKAMHVTRLAPHIPTTYFYITKHPLHHPTSSQPVYSCPPHASPLS